MFKIYVADQQMHTAKNALLHIINYLHISVNIATTVFLWRYFIDGRNGDQNM